MCERSGVINIAIEGQLLFGAFSAAVVASAFGGLWLGLRLVVAGTVLGLLTLGGYFLLRDYFLLWMAVVGSGALLLAGVWLRRA